MSEITILQPSEEISVIEGTKDELIVFKTPKDTEAFLALLKLNNQKNNRTLVTLHSGENAKQFLNRYQNYAGKIFLCLTGDRAGNMTTLKILTEFQNKNIKDIRELYHISESENQNLEEYLKNKLQHEEKTRILVTPKNTEDADYRTQSEGISNSQYLGSEISERNSGELLQRSQPEQNGNILGGQDVDGNDAGNGLEDTIGKHLDGKPERGLVDGTQPQNAPKNEGAEHSLGGIVSGRTVSNGTAEIVKTSTQNNEALEILISKYKGQKLTNEQVEEVVSTTCFVSSDNQIKLKENLNITEDLKEICNQFKSGGTAKEGRGILDEYYTDSRIVDAVRNLIKDQFKNRQEIEVLEPSVGTGNFLYAVKGLGMKLNITAFEINEITAKIAKILHPEANINLRSFETEFIDKKGNKKDFSEKYDLVIGNPPYGAKIEKGKDKFSIKSSESAILFMQLAYKLLRGKGKHSFIIPKPFIYSSTWEKIREFFVDEINLIADCGKVWDSVKLEQIIYFLNKDICIKSYHSLLLKYDEFVNIKEISKNTYYEYGFFLNQTTNIDLNIASRIRLNTLTLLDISEESNRGGMFQNLLNQSGEIKVLAGINIQRYEIRGLKGFICKKDQISNNSYLRENSVLFQEIISHIQYPTDHIKLIGTIIRDIKDYVILDTIQQITLKSNYSNKFILGLLNSKLINWYIYRFIFAKAIRTMHFSNQVINRIPIPKIDLEEQLPIICLVDTIIECKELVEKYNKNLDILNSIEKIEINSEIKILKEKS